MTDLVTFGEVMALFVAAPGKPLRYAETFTRSFAGAEATVAVGLARLGHRTAWSGRLGDDPFGHAAAAVLRGEGVDTAGVVHDPAAPTGLLVRDAHPARRISVVYHRAGSAASRTGPADVDEDRIAAARFLHVTGITPALSPGCAEAVAKAVQVAKAHGVQVSFDPNYRRKLWSEPDAQAVLRPLLDHVDLVLTGQDELHLLTGERERGPAAAVLLDRGVGTVVVKDGANGAWATTGAGEWSAPAHRVPVVDPVGAGDAFAVGFLDGVLRGEPVEACLRGGNACGALSVQALGDLDGLPHRADLDRYESDVDR